MKAILVLIVLLLSSPLWARNENDPDILVQTRFNDEWSDVFLHHLRTVMINQGLGDPYQRTIEEPLIFDLKPQVSRLTDPAEDWYQKLLKFLKIDLLQSDFKLIIEKFRYKVENVDAAISPSTRNAEMVWTVKHNVDGLGLGADSMTLQVSLHSTTGKPIVFDIALEGVELAFEGLTLPVEGVWRSGIKEEQVNVTLQKVDLRKAMLGLQQNPDNVILNVKDIIVPPVEIRIGDRRIKIDPTKVKNWILTRKEEMKRFILDVLVLKNIDEFEDLTGEDDPSLTFPRTTFAETEMLAGAARLDSLVATQTQMRARLKSVFCLPQEASDAKSCIETAPRNPRAERLGRDLEASLRQIYKDLEEKDANIIVSLSEPYLNQAITAAIKAGLLNEAFGDGEVTLAEGGALLQMDKAGDVFHGYIHLTNKLTGWDRRFTGRSSITFPVKIGVRIRLEQNAEGIPTLYADMAEAEAPNELLLKGAPHIGMASNIATVPRFRGKVIQKVQDAVKKFQGQRLTELPLPFLKGTFLEKTQFKSDGFGRANALFKVEERKKLH